MPDRPNTFARGSKKTLIIGFDFGTHSTKVVFRDRGKESGRIAVFDESMTGYPRFASPSVIRLVDGRLFFGTQAIRGPQSGELFTSLKVSLLSTSDNLPTSADGVLASSLLVAAYWTWAFQRIQKSLAGEGYENIFLNLAAPMSHVEDQFLKHKYRKILQAAWNMSFGSNYWAMDQGVPYADACQRLIPLLNEPAIPAEVRRFEVLPETIAPVVSLSLDPLMRPGMYMIIDAGAGTTEMTVFHVSGVGADHKALCYRDETMVLGGNDLNRAEELVSRERELELRTIIDRLTKQYRKLWANGFMVDSRNHAARNRWKRLNLILSGGGTRHCQLANALVDVNPLYAWPKAETSLSVCRHIPGTLELSDMEGDEGSLFAVANGLAIERRLWPVIFEPNEIETMEFG